MNTEDFNTKVWKAHLDAFFKMAGLDGNFNNKKAAFLAATANTTFIPCQIIPAGTDPNTMPDASSTTVKDGPDAKFNQAVLGIADFLPASDTPYFAQSGRRRLDGLKTYLAWVDSGAPLDQTAYRVWQTDKSAADALQQKLDTALTAAQTAYNALPASPPPASFLDWLNTSYPQRFDIQTKQSQLDQMNARLQGEESRALGPLGLKLESEKKNADTGAKHFQQPFGQFNMLCNAAWEPFYTMESTTYKQQYDSWARMTSDPQATPFASLKVDYKNADSIDYSTYGLQRSKVEGGLLLADPFFFFGSGDYSSREAKHAMYTNNNFTSIQIEVTLLGSPKAFRIQTGDWWGSDPKTTFSNHYISGAPANLDDNLYPFVTQAIVGYGVGYKIVLDQNSYNQFKSFHAQDTSNQVIGIFDIIFEGKQDSNSTDQRSFNEIKLDDKSQTITILPEKSMIPTLVGVIVARDNADSMILEHQLTPQNILTGDVSSFQPLDKDIDTAAIGHTLTAFNDHLDDSQRGPFHALIRCLLRGDTDDHVVDKLVDLVEKITNGQRLDESEDNPSNIIDRITFNQKCGNSEVSIVVESKDTSPKTVQQPPNAVEVVCTPAAASALSMLSHVLDEVKETLATQNVSKYLQSSSHLRQLVEPVISTFSALTMVHVSKSNVQKLVRPWAEFLARIGSCYGSPPTIALGSWKACRFLQLCRYGVGSHELTKWGDLTPKIPSLTFGGYGISFYNRHYSMLNFDFTVVKAWLRFTDNDRKPLELHGGNNAYFWFNGTNMYDVRLEIEASAVRKAGDDTEVTYMIFQV